MKKVGKIGLALAVVVLVGAMAVALTACGQEDDESFLEHGEDYSALLNPSRDYVTIVNGMNPYMFGSTYDQELQKDLVYVTDVIDGDTIGVEKAAYLAFTELQRALLTKKGMIIGLYDAYRTREQQQQVYDAYANLEGWSDTNKVEKPGFSEHHTGLLLNVVIWYQGEDDSAPQWYTETAERQQQIAYFRNLHQMLADFGFIDRYPVGKESVTGVPCEPYEIRFVGSAQAAHAIMDNGLCLEEYLAGVVGAKKSDFEIEAIHDKPYTE